MLLLLDPFLTCLYLDLNVTKMLACVLVWSVCECGVSVVCL